MVGYQDPFHIAPVTFSAEQRQQMGEELSGIDVQTAEVEDQRGFQAGIPSELSCRRVDICDAEAACDRDDHGDAAHFGSNAHAIAFHDAGTPPISSGGTAGGRRSGGDSWLGWG